MGNGVSRKNAFEMYWPLLTLQYKVTVWSYRWYSEKDSYRFLNVKKNLSHFSFLKLNLKNLPLRFVPVGNCDRTKFFLRFSMRWLLAREGYAQSTVPCTFAHIFWYIKKRIINICVDFDFLLDYWISMIDLIWMIIVIKTTLYSVCWIKNWIEKLMFFMLVEL